MEATEAQKSDRFIENLHFNNQETLKSCWFMLALLRQYVSITFWASWVIIFWKVTDEKDDFPSSNWLIALKMNISVNEVLNQRLIPHSANSRVRSGYWGSCPGWFWVFLEMEILQPFLAAVAVLTP